MFNPFDINAPVALNTCSDYDLENVRSVIKTQLASIITDCAFFKNKKVVIKPNLLMKATPNEAVTTHPIVMQAAIEVIKTYEPESIVIAESPGGPYSAATLKTVYKSTGMTDVSEKTGVPLNYDTTFETLSFPDGKSTKSFDIITPIANADVIVNICKLKTHSLTTMSASVKNLFGTVPGIHKFEMHTRFKEPATFEPMIAELCAFHASRAPILSIVDAIIGMEGNGPSGGDTRRFGWLLSSLNPFNLDTACSALIGLDGQVGIIEYGKAHSFCVKSPSELNMIGEKITDHAVTNIKLPDTKSLIILKKLPTMFGGLANKLLEPRPVINKSKCIGCGECKRSCPASTIVMKQKNNGKKVAHIESKACIKCFCCQELCPIRAVKIKKNPVFRILK